MVSGAFGGVGGVGGVWLQVDGGDESPGIKWSRAIRGASLERSEREAAQEHATSGIQCRPGRSAARCASGTKLWQRKCVLCSTLTYMSTVHVNACVPCSDAESAPCPPDIQST
jgi:hypothetical protein